jgi:hypothetical protein
VNYTTLKEDYLERQAEFDGLPAAAVRAALLAPTEAIVRDLTPIGVVASELATWLYAGTGSSESAFVLDCIESIAAGSYTPSALQGAGVVNVDLSAYGGGVIPVNRKILKSLCQRLVDMIKTPGTWPTLRILQPSTFLLLVPLVTVGEVTATQRDQFLALGYETRLVAEGRGYADCSIADIQRIREELVS